MRILGLVLILHNYTVQEELTCYKLYRVEVGANWKILVVFLILLGQLGLVVMAEM